jgi:SPP1 gp7 family putative phage head morphogenesis protein
MAKPSLRAGFNQPFPLAEANSLARRWTTLDRKALLWLRENLPEALAAQSPAELENMLARLTEAAPGMLTDEEIAEEAQSAADRLNGRHRKRFFAAVAGLTGLRLLGTDDPADPPPALSAAQVAFAPPEAPGIVSPRPKGNVLVKVNTNPTLFAHQMVGASTDKMTVLRGGIPDGVRDAVIRAQVLGDADPDELAARLLAEWQAKGVPSKLPINRTNAIGDPVLLTIESHAAFTARDQLGSLDMELSRARQTAAGITHFQWVTRGDSKVRAEHRARAGRTFSWSEGANGEFPGGPPNCRCRARAVVDAGQVLASGMFVPLAA